MDAADSDGPGGPGGQSQPCPGLTGGMNGCVGHRLAGSKSQKVGIGSLAVSEGLEQRAFQLSRLVTSRCGALCLVGGFASHPAGKVTREVYRLKRKAPARAS